MIAVLTDGNLLCKYPKKSGLDAAGATTVCPFKLAVVGEVARGELSYKQAQRRYGIQGRSTVLTWCRRYATHFITFQAGGPTSPTAPAAMSQSLEQCIKELETQLRDQKRLSGKQLKDA